MNITVMLISTMCFTSGLSPQAGPLPVYQVPRAVGKCKMVKNNQLEGLACKWHLIDKKGRRKKLSGTSFYVPRSTKGKSMAFQVDGKTELLFLTPARFAVFGIHPMYQPDYIKQITCHGKATYRVQKNKKEKI